MEKVFPEITAKQPALMNKWKPITLHDDARSRISKKMKKYIEVEYEFHHIFAVALVFRLTETFDLYRRGITRLVDR